MRCPRQCARLRGRGERAGDQESLRVQSPTARVLAKQFMSGFNGFFRTDHRCAPFGSRHPREVIEPRGVRKVREYRLTPVAACITAAPEGARVADLLVNVEWGGRARLATCQNLYSAASVDPTRTAGAPIRSPTPS